MKAPRSSFSSYIDGVKTHAGVHGYSGVALKAWLIRYLTTIGWVALVTAAAWSARAVLALPDLVALFLLAIMLTAVRDGRGPAVFAAALSVVAYDLFFITPFYTFAVDEPRHLLTFSIMFIVGLVMSHLTLRVRRQEEAVRAAELRVRTEEIRSSLLSAVSHDLRTPLASIAGAGRVLRDQGDELSSAARRELLDSVCDQASRLERMVVNLLAMTRLEGGAVDVRREWVPAEEIIGSAIARVEERLGGRELLTDVPHDLPLVHVDPVLIEQALLNLLENAILHTAASAQIRVSARWDAGRFVLEVVDDGPGLPEPTEPLFDKFVRRASAGTEGAGLGLAIVRGIARAHGGEATASNLSTGGARFVVSLPAPADAPPLTSEGSAA